MRVLVVLTYYRPHISGLTIYAERQARALRARGHEVTVLTSRFDPRLPRREIADGVRVERVPVLARISKGVLMPSLGWRATREVLRHDAVLLHLPQIDAAGIALRARALGRPTVVVYHCDLRLPRGLHYWLAERAVGWAHDVALRAADHVVTHSDDFAAHSSRLRRCAARVVAVPPPVPAESPPAARTPPRPPVIGMATRFASEKGVSVLLEALPRVFARVPDATVLFAGPVDDVWGEAELRARLLPRIAPLEAAGRWRFTGVLPDDAMPAFYRRLSVLAVPSLNSTESFGLVQIEAMLRGVPVVASDLPGVRQPIRLTGFGAVVPVGDAAALADALVAQIERPAGPRQPLAELAHHFSPDEHAVAIERLLRAR
ncbi:MAG: glycosyltransferase family 4 protein [Vicinamibacterales bacterium]